MLQQRKVFAWLAMVIALTVTASVGYALCLTGDQLTDMTTQFVTAPQTAQKYTASDTPTTEQQSLFIRDLVGSFLDKNPPAELAGSAGTPDNITAAQQIANLTAESAATTWKKLDDLKTAQQSANVGRVVLVTKAKDSTPAQIAILLPTPLPENSNDLNDPTKPHSIAYAKGGTGAKKGTMLSDMFQDTSNLQYFRYRF
jgi:hypothetical protein